MNMIVKTLKHLPYFAASVLGIVAVITFIPGGLVLLAAGVLANIGDRLTSGPWRDNY